MISFWLQLIYTLLTEILWNNWTVVRFWSIWESSSFSQNMPLFILFYPILSKLLRNFIYFLSCVWWKLRLYSHSILEYQNCGNTHFPIRLYKCPRSVRFLGSKLKISCSIFGVCSVKFSSISIKICQEESGETKLLCSTLTPIALFSHCSFLLRKGDDVEKILDEWKEYKMGVPTYGAIILDETLENVSCNME